MMGFVLLWAVVLAATYISPIPQANGYSTPPNVPRSVPKGCYYGEFYRTIQGPSVTSKDMTISYCLAYCGAIQAKFAALEDGSLCTCGLQIQHTIRRRYTECNRQCPGDATLFCGGFRRQYVYQIFIPGIPRGKRSLQYAGRVRRFLHHFRRRHHGHRHRHHRPNHRHRHHRHRHHHKKHHTKHHKKRSHPESKKGESKKKEAEKKETPGGDTKPKDNPEAFMRRRRSEKAFMRRRRSEKVERVRRFLHHFRRRHHGHRHRHHRPNHRHRHHRHRHHHKKHQKKLHKKLPKKGEIKKKEAEKKETPGGETKPEDNPQAFMRRRRSVQVGRVRRYFPHFHRHHYRHPPYRHRPNHRHPHFPVRRHRHHHNKHHKNYHKKHDKKHHKKKPKKDNNKKKEEKNDEAPGGETKPKENTPAPARRRRSAGKGIDLYQKVHVHNWIDKIDQE